METSAIKQRRVSSLEYGTRDNKESFTDKKSEDHNSLNSEYAAAIAAATFAIHSSFEERMMSSQHQKKEKTREGNLMSHGDKLAPSFARPREPYPNTTLSIHGSGNTKVDAWEKAELLKIKKRQQCFDDLKQKELDQRRSINWQHYQNRLARIDHVAGGARSQAEKNRRKEEQKIEERAKEMRSLGVSSPKYCFLC
ncbi:hypothetical protein L1987_66668 [Smallanthus sonchifolius]|uniref:Uncharacterized protein n=1 Tax=Smallanthus sonchifolius TaxID=185202 RepID=A0ACB9BXZ2_9ASTR|nr:hypothetical protein L1987_66668 [Smallanthus sonchifolius]